MFGVFIRADQVLRCPYFGHFVLFFQFFTSVIHLLQSRFVKGLLWRSYSVIWSSIQKFLSSLFVRLLIVSFEVCNTPDTEVRHVLVMRLVTYIHLLRTVFSCGRCLGSSKSVSQIGSYAINLLLSLMHHVKLVINGILKAVLSILI